MLFPLAEKSEPRLFALPLAFQGARAVR
jgi:hypothetical protein